MGGLAADSTWPCLMGPWVFLWVDKGRGSLEHSTRGRVLGNGPDLDFAFQPTGDYMPLQVVGALSLTEAAQVEV